MKNAYKETDMYIPVRKLLESQGFTVRGEVKGCDVAAVREDILWIVEMKLSANLTLIYQAMNRKTATDWVFVAVPRPGSGRDKNFLMLQRLLKKIEIGLITVALDSPLKHAEILLFPTGKADKSNKKAASVRKEISGRMTDTTGGTTKTVVNTAYRERAVRIACLLEAKGPMKAADLIKQGCESDAYAILRLNAFGWFNKISRGLYELSAKGWDYLKENDAAGIVSYYRMKAIVSNGKL